MSEKLDEAVRAIVRDIVSRLPPSAFKPQRQSVAHCASCLLPMTRRSYAGPYEGGEREGERWCHWCHKAWWEHYGP